MRTHERMSELDMSSLTNQQILVLKKRIDSIINRGNKLEYGTELKQNGFVRFQ